MSQMNSCAFIKNMCFVEYFINVSLEKMTMLLFGFSTSFLIFYIFVLSITESKTLKFPNIIVDYLLILSVYILCTNIPESHGISL
jgi:hypothetical protein